MSESTTNENDQEKTEVEKQEKAAQKKAKAKSKKGSRKSKTNATEELGNKLNEVNEKYLRLTAEFDNYRKRTLKEKMELTKTAGASLLVNMLPILDDFDRAIQSVDDATDITSVKEGLNLIYNKFNDFLTVNNVKEIEAVNQEFDVELHEAITKIPAPSDEMKGKVIDVVQKGYALNDKVIRYPKVVVGE